MVRVKYRYYVLIFECKNKETIDNSEVLKSAIERKALDLFGVFGFALINLKSSIIYRIIQIVKMFNKMTRMAIIQVLRENNKLLWTTLSLIRYVDRKEIAINCIHLSGDI